MEPAIDRAEEGLVAATHAALSSHARFLLLLGATGALLIGSAIAFALFPGDGKLILFGLVSVPLHALFSPVPHEPALLYIAKLYPALPVAIASSIGCLLAGLYDYALLGWLLNHRYVRPRFENRSFYQKTVRQFYKAPFGTLIVFAFTPLPFFPVKLLSIASHYPLWKYETALLIGRFPRYYLMAVAGYALQIPNLLLFALAAGALALTLYRVWERGPDR